MARILVAMSGGVDSSVTAARLLEAGHSPIGVTLRMGRGCDQLAIEDARRVAQTLGLEHRVLDVTESFRRKVVSYFVSSYVSGETPNPCAVCNRHIKFKELIDLMGEIGADGIATGHYASVVENRGVYELRKAADRAKDQSYFLSTISYEFLPHITFPLNSITKPEVRDYARRIGLHVANKRESQEVCFIETDYREFLSRMPEAQGRGGLVRHVNGDILGKHSGLFNYTIGQRRGLGLAYGKPIFVVNLDRETNTVYVGDSDSLYSDRLEIYDLNLLSEIEEGKEYGIKLRSSCREQRGSIELLADGSRALVSLGQPTRAIARGQLCCLYDGDRVVGSGWIA
ncbi:MAG: tRNA 2-thiouridine(34) synthase MnmA [Rickettsiales bacterium]|jgi:tRNA-specific 2-thiouridylase|nr:tRNA 2-thiouridine(34) synthase MnmA [Rickettsiales bacterium]